jgi:SAM-dependent methyltransferase
MPKTREVIRDTREFDTTSLREGMQGKALHRDYSAHFFRWSFARRFIKKTDHVLEVGCGEERPLWRMLFHGTMPRAASYTGVDLTPLTKGVGLGHQLSDIIGGFDFTAQYKKLIPRRPEVNKQHGYDVAVNLEVIEHMGVPQGAKLLRGLFYHLRPGGVLLLSTPVYDGKRHAANHIHEYTVPELQQAIQRAGFIVERRFGTFMDVRHIGKGTANQFVDRENTVDNRMILTLKNALGQYFDNDALANIFGPLYPDHARNNLWVCRKPGN